MKRGSTRSQTVDAPPVYQGMINRSYESLPRYIFTPKDGGKPFSKYSKFPLEDLMEKNPDCNIKLSL